METCLGLGNRQQRTTNIKSQKDLKQQHQSQQQQQQQHQHQQQQLHYIPVTQQNYYTQQHLQSQRQLIRAQSTNAGSETGAINGGGIVGGITKGQGSKNQQSRQGQPQGPLEHHPLNILTDNNNINVTAIKNATATAAVNIGTTISNPFTTQKVSNNYSHLPPPPEYETPASDLNCALSSVTNDAKSPPTALQEDTIVVEVTAALPSTTNVCQHSTSIATNVSIHSGNRSCRKYTRQQQQKQRQHQQQSQQQLQQDLNAIEVCRDQELPLSCSQDKHGRLPRTSSRIPHNELDENNHHMTINQWPNLPPTSNFQKLQLHQHQQQQQKQQQQQQKQQHNYSYAYYEPGAAMRHTNIPYSEIASKGDDLAPPNSIRALLSKGKKNKLLVSPATRQNFQNRLTGGATMGSKCSTISNNSATMNVLPSGGHNINTTGGNVYEGISASSTSSSTNSVSSHHQLRATPTSHSDGSITQILVEEELRRVQNRHRKILGELNLSVEAMLMPESPPHNSPKNKEIPAPTISVTNTSGQPLRLTSTSADNICDTSLVELLNTVGPTDELLSPIQNSSSLLNTITCHTSCLGEDLDSGFSGSSGASYIGSLRLHKTNALLNSRITSNKTNNNSKINSKSAN